MEEAEIIFNLFYILMCFCIFYPPTEFIASGWTLENIFSKFLVGDHLDFIRYHQKRTTITLLIHGALPGIYFIIYYLKFSNDDDDLEYNYHKVIIWNVAQRISIFTFLFILSIVSYWSINDWENHPISKTLMKFSNSQTNGYRRIAEDINNEFRRNDVLKMQINSISSIIATENWIMKTTPYFVHFVHQSDTSLHVTKSDTFTIAADTSDLLQMINIVVKSSRHGIQDFHIRIKALDFKTLQERISRPITIPSNIHFHHSLIDRFIEVFKEQVSMNPVIRTNQISDNCFACMIAEPNIKIQKQCIDEDECGNPIADDERCRNCYCRPMWCIDCLARWFAVRQNESEHDVWLQKKCTCPLCRAKFCILDVCYIEKIESFS